MSEQIVTCINSRSTTYVFIRDNPKNAIAVQKCVQVIRLSADYLVKWTPRLTNQTMKQLLNMVGSKSDPDVPCFSTFVRREIN